ncbi:arabinogalactan peptide 23-like [Melia azedarach]|uniref:Arabinogalactan peptide 23-like n=1 Tax=Melia azedarach TaxID=155640 RepID=A0ACC1YL41_MELAZ|nr:arabinogalactan peptide 23-like [Melia azedarach]
MDMKKISCTILVVFAAIIIAALADRDADKAPSPAPKAATLSPSAAASASAPTVGDSSATLPVMGTVIGALLLSFFIIYLQH